MNYKFGLSVEIIFKSGAVKNIDKVIKENKYKKGILISSKRFIESEYGNEFVNSLKEYINNIHFGISANPTIEDVENTTNAIKHSNADFIIALGGGSILDCAKISSSMAAMNTNIRYFLENKLEIDNNIPVIAIPTTAGTGSEVTAVSVISNKYTEDKFPIKSDYLVPKVAIIDPELTLTVPKNVTASSGIDVLSHALESYYSKNNNPISDLLAIKATKLVINSLKNAVNNLDNLEYRENMCQASLLAGMAFAVTGTAACHGISYPLTSKYNIPHGEACGLTQDKVLLLNSKVDFDRIDKLSKEVGYSNVEEFSNLINSLNYLEISGKLELLQKLELKLDIKPKRIVNFCVLDTSSKLEDNGINIKPKKIRFGNINKIAKLYEDIDEFENTTVENIKNGLRTGRGYCIEINKKVVAMAKSTLETKTHAMLVGVGTHPDFRNRGLATKCVVKICKDIINENKIPCLFYDNIEAGKIYNKLGFKERGYWAIYGR